MAAVHRFSPDSIPAPPGKYTHLSITGANARIATFSGQIGIADATVLPSTAADQSRLIFDAIFSLLESQGSKPADLIKLVTYVVSRDALVAFNSVRDEIYARWFPAGDFPASSIVIVAGLAAESLLVEVEGSFVCPGM